jgi:hypothetical protein
MILTTRGQPEDKESKSIEPDLVIQSLDELLDIFPNRAGKG